MCSRMDALNCLLRKTHSCPFLTPGVSITVSLRVHSDHPVSDLMGLQWLLWWPCCCLILTLWLLSWDLIPGRKAPGCTCLVRMPHCLPHALQAWDHAALYSVLFSQCPSGMISHNVKYNFQVVGCMMACAVDIWSLWCWKALGCYWSSLFLETLRTSSLLLIYVYGCFWSLL